MPDLRTLTEAWQKARTALDAANKELRTARAGHEVATQCEREAWESMSKCREQDEVPVRVAPPGALDDALRKAQADHAARVQADQARGAANAWPTGQISYMGTNIVGMSRTGW